MTPEELLSRAASEFPGTQKAAAEVKGYLTLRLPAPEGLRTFIAWLKEKQGFSYLDMITAVDYLGPVDARGFIMDPNPNAFLPEGAVPRVEVPSKASGFPYRDSMELLYCLTNLGERMKVFLKLELPREDPKAPSLCSLFKAADWQEREVFDLFGVRFEGHPNLAKILTPDFIQGHPLRKDYAHVKDRFD